MLLILGAIIILLLCVNYIYENRKLWQLHFKLKHNLKSYPIIGQGYLFLGSTENMMTSMKLLGEEAIRQRHGILSIRALHYFYTVVADAEAAEVVLKSNLDKIWPMKMAKILIGNGTLIAPVPIWRVRRKKLLCWSAAKNVKQFVDIFDRNSRIMANLLEDKAGRGAFPIWKYIGAYALDTVCETTLNVKFNGLRDPNQPFLYSFEKFFHQAAKRIFAPWYYNDIFYWSLPWHWEGYFHVKRMQKIVAQIIKEEKEKVTVKGEEVSDETYQDNASGGGKSLINIIKKPFRNGESYSDLEIQEEILMMILAGSDTTATGQAFAILMLGAHQHEQELVYEEIRSIFGTSTRPVTADDLRGTKYLDAFIKETLRLYPSIPIAGRNIETDTTLPSGVVLPAKAQVIINNFAIMRNPNHWGHDAHQFRPSRFYSGEPLPANANLSFSLGPRNCIGYDYAIMSMKTLIINVLRRYKVLHAQELHKDQTPPPPRLKFEIMLKAVDNFTIRLEKRV